LQPGTHFLKPNAQRHLQPGIHGLALQCQDSEDALVGAPQGFFIYKPFQRFDTKRELAPSQRAFRANRSGSQPRKVFRQEIVRLPPKA